MDAEQSSAKAWLVEWFEKHATLAPETLSASGDKNYLETGWIDSFEFITLVSDIENTFHISFSPDEFQNRSFATLDGLSAIIDKKLHGAS